MTTVKQNGTTVEVAIEKALRQLNVSRNEVEVEVLSAGKKGFLGIGAKDAEVNVTVKHSPEREQSTEIQNTPKAEAQQPDSTIEQSEEKTDTQPVQKDQDEVIQTESEPNEQETNPLKQDEVVQEEDVFNDENPIEKTMDYLTNVAQAMDIHDLEISVEEDGKYVYLQLESKKAALIIGKRGQTLNALQQLAQLIANQYSSQFKVVRLNVGDYRERREQSLAQLANRMADKAVETGRKVQLEPMPSYERKIIHHTLADRIDIETHSEGADPHRHLVIEPII